MFLVKKNCQTCSLFYKTVNCSREQKTIFKNSSQIDWKGWWIEKKIQGTTKRTMVDFLSNFSFVLCILSCQRDCYGIWGLLIFSFIVFFFKLLTVSPLPSGLSFWLWAIIWYESCGFWRTQIGEKVASKVGCKCSLAW